MVGGCAVLERLGVRAGWVKLAVPVLPFVMPWRDSSRFGSSVVLKVLGMILQQGKRELSLVPAEQGKAGACSVK